MTDRSKLIGYARVSTKEQDLGVQIDALLQYGVEPDDIFSDKISGASKRREGFNDCMRRLRAGDTLVVHKLDRLGRTVLGILDITENLRRREIDLAVIAENIDTKSAWGKAFMQIAMVFSELERNLAIERTQATLQRKKELGEPMGRPPVISETVWNFAVEQRKRSISFPKICERAAKEHGYKGKLNSFYTYRDRIESGAPYPWTKKTAVADDKSEPDWAET